MNQFAILYGDRFLGRAGENQGLLGGRPLSARAKKLTLPRGFPLLNVVDRFKGY